MEPKEEMCENCRFYSGTMYSGVCNYNPPVVVGHRNGQAWSFVPRVKSDHFCGMHVMKRDDE